MINENQNKPITQQAQEFSESIDNSEKERSDEEIQQDNQKVQDWLDELQANIDNLKDS